MEEEKDIRTKSYGKEILTLNGIVAHSLEWLTNSVGAVAFKIIFPLQPKCIF
jgi:hypothetical protein